MSSSKICHWQNETLHETVVILNCTSMSSFKPLPLQLESGFSPLPVPQSLPCSPFFTTKWSALDWGDKFKDELQENKGTTRSRTRKREQGRGGNKNKSKACNAPGCFHHQEICAWLERKILKWITIQERWRKIKKWKTKQETKWGNFLESKQKMQGSMTWKACKTQLKMKYYLAAVFIKENRTCAVLLQLGLGSFPVAVTTLKPVFSNRRYKEYQGKYFTYFQVITKGNTWERI